MNTTQSTEYKKIQKGGEKGNDKKLIKLRKKKQREKEKRLLVNNKKRMSNVEKSERLCV